MGTELDRHNADLPEAARRPAWLYDEMKPCGVNYNSPTRARSYDVTHGRFRDYRQEAEEILAHLQLDDSATVIDMGCGTGAFALYAASHCARVYAVDVSKAMLRYARRKARKAGIDNIEFHHGGFLTYDHGAEPVDAISSVAVLHHLPDFWKLVGLRRLASMLKPGGRLFLFDVVFSFGIAEYERHIDRFIGETREQMGPGGRNESETHIREEYSTWDWIMEGLLEKAGFSKQIRDYRDGFLVSYLCTKRGQ